MTAAQLFQDLVEVGEHPRIEAKKGSEAGHSVMETVCSFANEPGLGGGYLLLGVERAEELFGPRYVATGVLDAEKVQEDVVTQAAGMFNRPVRVEVSPDEIDGATVVKVFVPEARAAEKPIFFRSKSLPRGAYRRYGTSDVACTEDDLAIFYENRQLETYDAHVHPRAQYEDIDPKAVDEYRRLRSEKSPDAEELSYDDRDLLRALGCLGEHEGSLLPTIAGLVLFGSKAALRRLFPLVRVDYIRVPGVEWVEDPDERYESLDLQGPLIQVIRRAEAAIVDDLVTSFSLPEGRLERTDVLPIPRGVIREAVVNAVMHRSYREHSPLQIIRYSNRIEIKNPGYSLKPQEQLGEPRSEHRNPLIAAVLYDTRLAETKGTGIRAMRRLMRQADLSPPTFESDRKANEFTARLLLHHFLTPEDLTWLAQFGDLALSQDEKMALVFLREVRAIDNSVYRDLSGFDTLKASHHLRRLKDAGLIELRGKGSATFYLPTPAFYGSLSMSSEPTRTGIPGSEGDIPEYGMGDHNPGMGTPDPGMPNNRDVLLQELPAPLAESVRQLGKKAPEAQWKRTIRELCEHRAFTKEELGALTGRNPSYVQERYVNPMLQEGLLERTHPEMPRHPQQGYRARATSGLS